MENNSLAQAYTNQQGKMGMAARCGMFTRGQWDGHVTLDIAMKWDEKWNEMQISPINELIELIELIALNGKPHLLLLSLFSLLGNLSYYCSYSA